MAGLSFLSKKSWHTSNLDNQERVWLAEQKQAAEEKKTLELQKQIQEEIEREEFRRLKNDARGGDGQEVVDRGINWMYEGGGAAAASSNDAAASAAEDAKNEEYLLGKEYVPEGAKAAGDFAMATSMTAALEKASTAGAAIGSGDAYGPPGARDQDAGLRLQDDAPAVAANDDQDGEWGREFHLRHEDPMFAVHQRRKEQVREDEKRRRLMERAGVAPTRGTVARGPDAGGSGDEDGRDEDSRDDDGSRRRKKRRKGGKKRSKAHRSGGRRDHESRRRRRSREKRSSPSRSRSPSHEPGGGRRERARRHGRDDAGGRRSGGGDDEDRRRRDDRRRHGDRPRGGRSEGARSRSRSRSYGRSNGRENRSRSRNGSHVRRRDDRHKDRRRPPSKESCRRHGAG